MDKTIVKLLIIIILMLSYLICSDYLLNKRIKGIGIETHRNYINILELQKIFNI